MHQLFAEFLTRFAETSPDPAAMARIAHYHDAKTILVEFLSQCEQGHEMRYADAPNVAEPMALILNAERDIQVSIFLTAFEANARRESDLESISNHKKVRVVLRRIRYTTDLLVALARKRLPFSADQVLLCLELAADQKESELRVIAVRIAISYINRHNDRKVFRQALINLRDAVRYGDDDARKILSLVDEALGQFHEMPVAPGEAFGDAICSTLASLDEDVRRAWIAILTHAKDCSASKPSVKWLEIAKQLVPPIGEDTFIGQIREWLPAFARLDLSLPQGTDDDVWTAYQNVTFLAAQNYNILKGVTWALQLIDEPVAAALIGDIGAAAFVTIAQVGPRSTKVGNASIVALSAMSGLAPVTQLSRLKQRVKYVQPQAMIAKALTAAALRAGMIEADIEELATPTFGMDSVGWLREDIGDFAVEIELTPRGCGEPTWVNREGKSTKTTPVVVIAEYSHELSAWKRVQADVKTILPMLRDRIEGLLVLDRSWQSSDWRERYLDHPLMGILARSFIWHFSHGEQRVLAHSVNGVLVDVTGNTVEWLNEPDVTVRLWHPIGFPDETVRLWRARLEELGIRQPFKQAHREIYLLTEAEITTNTYSNRFAGHILRQHQLSQLCRQRSWQYHLQGGFDGANYPTLDRPDLGYKAEFWVSPAGGEVSESWINIYVSTDQVRFYPAQGSDPVAMAEVPAVVFSELMRDVDLFVGVCSIGNDPNWTDSGAGNPFGDYWQSFSFGNLSQLAQTRRDVLSRLVPRLKIADRCTLDAKFLIVRGDIRTYKIHLGSGNIMMEPNNQYLCIVPDRKGKTEDTLFLPFEGDRTLSVIISKAMMLADDTAITDKSITSQIKLR